MLDFSSWKDGIQKLFDDPKKHNKWLYDAEYCFSCGRYIYGLEDYESLTGCPFCSRSFID